ncbi:peptide deformylase [Candidatus Kaiserbacteria bacterium CG10_big_fil_rev_8_21_14_0_10_49_17]|uniref:Peptide deformylase n=1 Tax=Candidatus Kaiserbacteria bacterium CG10_big_fil_rev_8_21_14_0_10_49_17 TaxID=1974609 RepID=A0A2M6WE78_9BACT|nr:MAG: peptide deformylase [Candidatus Kaiserbacteria bacterium CG10_big_fil_rev_8_21_14_0_10_49_17]
MKRNIVQVGDAVLREKAQDIPIESITSAEIQTLIADMQETLSDTKTGVALAAPQVGVSLRLFIVAPRAFEESAEQKRVYINPVITKRSRSTEDMDEGCLSVDGTYGSVRRFEKVTIEAYDETGQKFTRGASGLLAQIFQHEVDHLDGTLYIDKAKTVRDVPKDND